jgi:serine/threonine protein phosphatase 1
MGNTYVMGDIHGAYRALKQCFERSKFNYEDDTLIFLGDVADGWPDSKRCIDELLEVRHLIYILGNHDLWLLQWLKTGVAENLWLQQGGSATISSYDKEVPSAHLALLERGLPYIIRNNKLFVHAGINLQLPLEQQDLKTFCWDRTLVQKAWELFIKEIQSKLTNFDEVYIGHTPIPFEQPIQSCEVIMMDTGAGWSGTLSMMDIDTKKIYVSDRVPSLYPGVEGRMKKSKT